MMQVTHLGLGETQGTDAGMLHFQQVATLYSVNKIIYCVAERMLGTQCTQLTSLTLKLRGGKQRGYPKDVKEKGGSDQRGCRPEMEAAET